MTKIKMILPLMALMLCMGVFLFPVTVSAQTSDTTSPTLTAELSGDTLRVEAKDDDSGIAAIYIDGNRVTTLINGAASVLFKDYAGNGRQVTVYATDLAGNRSQSVLIDNPLYQAPSPIPTPTAPIPVTPAPRPSASAPASTPAPEVSASPEPVPPVSETEEPVTGTSESAIPGNTGAFTPDGGGTVLDNATQQDGKEFFTITSTDGSVYYLIIDRQRGSENVYFLSAVTREDLVGLTDNGAISSPGLSQPQPQTPEHPLPTEQPIQPEPERDSSGGTGTVIFIVLAVIVIGGAAYYFKIVKPRKDASGIEEYEDEERDSDMEDMSDEDSYMDEAEEGDDNEYLSGGESWIEDGE